MNLYTGSFKDIVAISSKYTPVAISCGIPSWYHGKRYKKLAPPHWLMSHYRGAEDCDESDIEKYIAEYCMNVLKKLEPHKVVSDLESLSEGRDVVLVTQESSTEFSHRILVSAWFDNAGIKCSELAL